MTGPAGAGGGDEPPISRSVMDTVVEPGAQVEDNVVEQPPAMRPIAGGRHEADVSETQDHDPHPAPPWGVIRRRSGS